ncbi:glucosaminidase domain-containing protein [Erysipelothrix urinaevulpis]|uniref:glucosaminidase domain-containing protein n=1 Tax=Erysipelothrix urinaevulpis TaxID=2683717 RepID=UPI001358CF56|nr:glucosaminidase domain-containing protein [Erysipelothrix urinaevulpis]
MKNNKKAIELAKIGVAALVLIALMSLSTHLHYINKIEQQAIQVRLNNLKQDMKKVEFEQVMITNRLNEIDEVATSSTYQEPRETVDVTDYENNEFEALVESTWRIETGNGTSSLWTKQNNAGGIKDAHTGKYKVYETKEQGKHDLRILLSEYVKAYGYDLKSIRNRYCQCGPSDLKEFTQIYKEELNR